MQGEYEFFKKRSTLGDGYSLGDYQTDYWARQAGLVGATANQDDAERAFLLTVFPGSNGTVDDLNLLYWKNVAPVGLPAGLATDDYKWAAIQADLALGSGGSTPTTTIGKALAASKAGTAQTRMLVLGDSLTEGEGADARSKRWVDMLVSKLRTDLGISGSGVGLTPAAYMTYLNVSAPWRTQGTTSGTVQAPPWFMTQGNKGVNIASGASVTWTVTGDSADLVYCGTETGVGFGSFTISVDGTNVVTHDATADGYTPGKIIHFSLGTAGSHTVKVTASGGYALIDGLVVYNGDYTSGITYWDCSHTGYTAAQFSSTDDGSGDDNEDYRLGWQNYQPHLVIDAQYGINDFFNNTGTPSQVAANLTERFASYNALASKPTVIFAIPPISQDDLDTTWGSYHIDDYVNACITAAQAAGATIFDSRTAMGEPLPATDFAPEDSGGGHVHPNDTGQALFASALAETLE